MLLVALAAALLGAAPDTPPDPYEPPLPRPMAVETVRDPITDDIRVQATLRDQDRRLTLACDPHDFEFIRVTFTSSRWLVRGNFLTRRACPLQFPVGNLSNCKKYPVLAVTRLGKTLAEALKGDLRLEQHL